MSTSPRIVHVGYHDPQALDGVSATIVGQCEGLAALDLCLEIWTFHPGAEQVSESRTESGIPIFSLPRYKNPFLAAINVPSVTAKWISSRLPRINLFHLHSVFSPQNNFLQRLGVPFVITPNGGWSDSVINGHRGILKRIWISLFENKLWKNARFVQAVSTLEASQLDQLKEVARVIYLPNGVHSITEEQYPPFDGRDVWLFLGRLAQEQKGLDLLLDAYAKFAKSTGDVPKLVLVGPDFRGNLQLLKQQVERLGIEDRVEFTGPLRGSEKKKIFERTELFLHPSRWEGMPLAILEALGHGIPCLVSPQTGLGEWIQTNEAGWMVEADANKLAQGFARVLQDRQTLPARGRNALKCVQRDYSWDTITKNLLSLYQNNS